MSADTPDHEIRITLRDVYEKVEAHALVANAVSAKLDLYIGLNTSKDAKVTDHEARIRTMERWVFALPSMAFIVSVAGLVTAIFKA